MNLACHIKPGLFAAFYKAEFIIHSTERNEDTLKQLKANFTKTVKGLKLEPAHRGRSFINRIKSLPSGGTVNVRKAEMWLYYFGAFFSTLLPLFRF